jgi:hypothetical protein
MPSFQEVRNLVNLLPQLERQVDQEIAAVYRANARAGAEQLNRFRPPNDDPDFQTVSQGLFEPNSPRLERLVGHFEDARVRYHEVRAGVILGNFKGKISDLIRADAASRINEHRKRFLDWDGQQVHRLQQSLIEYQTSGYVMGMNLQEIMSSLIFRNALTGETYGWDEAAHSGKNAILGTDEDGSILFFSGLSSRIVSYTEVMKIAPELGNSLEILDADQFRYLEPVIERITEGMRQHGGIASWHRYEQRAIHAFAPEWTIRPTALAVHLCNVLFNVTSEAAGRSPIKLLRDDPSMPYVSVELVNRSLQEDWDVEWYGDPLG